MPDNQTTAGGRQADGLILAMLARYRWRSSAQLGEMTGLAVATLYPALVRLEEAGAIISE